MSPHRNFVVGPYTDPDKYQLLRQVGSGGEAELWQATVSVDGADETVAVKILRAEHAIDPEQWQERWSDQVEMLRLLRHPGVVGVHEFFAGPGLHQPGEADPATQRHFLVMNWVSGTDLREWAATPHDRFEVLRHLTQLAEVLDWLHSGASTSSRRPVVHGDISPGNVIINADGQAVLVDFGLFRMAQGAGTSRLGTQGYCAPEIARGDYSPGSDRYAFGALAHFMFTGQTPPPNDHSLREALLTQLRPLFDGADAETIVSIATPDPAERPAAGEWLRALRPHATTAAPREQPLPPPHPSTGPSRNRTLVSRVRDRMLLAAAALARRVRGHKVLAVVSGGLVVTLAVGLIWILTSPPLFPTTSSDQADPTTPSASQTDLLTVLPVSSRGFVIPRDNGEPATDSATSSESTPGETPQASPSAQPLQAPCEDQPFAAYDATSFGGLHLAVSVSDNPEDVEVTIASRGNDDDEDASHDSQDPEPSEAEQTTALEIGEDDENNATVDLEHAEQVRISFEGGGSGTCAIDNGWFQAL